MIKSILMSLVVICICQQIHCQNILEGIYSSLAPNQEAYNYFKFSKNGTFEYHSGASLGDDLYGKGHYLIKNDSLILDYDLTELQGNTFHKYKTYNNTLHSIEVKITVLDQKERKLSNVSVFDPEGNYGTLTNEEGNAVLNFEKDKGYQTITVSNVCSGNYSLNINTQLNYEITIYLPEAPIIPTAIKYEIIKYQILEQDNNQLKLKDGDQTINFLKL
ncbi:hypothetical protein DSM00_406 [Leeuwenhoekiella aequorea]|uniref:Uncharacterized protein n=2 Tax=Leeuwenhoekiella aequorea TaxID=283736 RepID=A0A4Q0PDV4_9FLAO|nr:hypothetical protein DSM00_406 [Leeuwenhoekiella aequorea]